MKYADALEKKWGKMMQKNTNWERKYWMESIYCLQTSFFGIMHQKIQIEHISSFVFLYILDSAEILQI